MSTGLDDREIERLLRATFDGRAETVTSGPGLDRSTPRAFRGTRRTVRWLAPLAAAAAVAAVVASVVAIENNPRTHHVAPATQRPTDRHPVSTPPPNPRYPGNLHPARCRSALPPAWQHAIDAGVVSLPGQDLNPLAISPDGHLVADATRGTHHELVLVDPDRSVHVLYDRSFPASWGEVDFGWAAIDPHWIVFTVLLQSHQGGPGPIQIDALDRDTGRVDVIRPASPFEARIVLGPATSHGFVYWTEIFADRGSAAGRVREYDLAGGTTRTLDQGLVSGPELDNGGVYWSKGATQSTARVVSGRFSATLPPGFTPTRGKFPLRTDGAVDAWAGEIDVSGGAARPGIWMWTHGMSRPVAAFRGTHFAFDDVALAMPYLIDVNRLLDTRTGATAQLVDPSRLTGPPPLAAGRYVAFAHTGPGGQTDLSLLDTSGLPSLRC